MIEITSEDRELAAKTIAEWFAEEAKSLYPRTEYQTAAGFVAAIAENIARDVNTEYGVSGYQLARFQEAARIRDEIVSRLPA